MNVHKIFLTGTLACLVLLVGCTPAQDEAQKPPQNQPNDNQAVVTPPAAHTPPADQANPPAPANPADTPTNQNQPVGQTPPPGGQAPAKAKVPSIDLTRELVLHPSLVIGKTTYADMVKKYGKPVNESSIKTGFRTGMAAGETNLPEIEEKLAYFKANPLTGAKMEKGYPYYFDKGQNQVLAAAPVFLLRGDLKDKLQAGTITLDDVKKVYGTPTRQTEGALEYYDFQRNAVLFVYLTESGKVSSLLTKYDVLYAGNQADLRKHEEAILRLSQGQT